MSTPPPPFFSGLCKICIVLIPYIWAKMKKMYFDPYFCQNWAKCIAPPPPPTTTTTTNTHTHLLAGRCWASLSETQPRTPPALLKTPFMFHTCFNGCICVKQLINVGILFSTTVPQNLHESIIIFTKMPRDWKDLLILFCTITRDVWIIPSF